MVSVESGAVGGVDEPRQMPAETVAAGLLPHFHSKGWLVPFVVIFGWLARADCHIHAALSTDRLIRRPPIFAQTPATQTITARANFAILQTSNTHKQARSEQ
jgi:hypothetical protein